RMKQRGKAMHNGAALTSLMSFCAFPICSSLQRKIHRGITRSSVSICPVPYKDLCTMLPLRKGDRISASSPSVERINESDNTMSNENFTRAITTVDGMVLIEQPDGSYRPAESETDWARLDTMTEEEVEQQAAEDMADLGIDPDWMEHAEVITPRTKDRVTVRLGHDILEWLKAQGRGYQTRINAILRAYVESQRARR